MRSGRHLLAGRGMFSDLQSRNAIPGSLALPDALQRQLQRFRRTVWAIKAVEAICGLLCGVLVAWLLLFLLDRVSDPPTAVRWMLWGVAVASCSLIPLAVHRWMWGLRGIDQVARLIARRYPSLGDQLLGIVEIVRHQGDQRSSRALRQAAIRQVADSAGRLDLSQAVPRPRHRAFAWMAAGPLLLACLLPALFPGAAANAWARFLFPWQSVERFTFTRVGRLPDSIVIPHGEPAELALLLAADSQWRPAQARAQVGSAASITADRDGDGYRLGLPPQLATVPLQMTVGDARQRVTLLPTLRPEITSVAATVQLPDYLGRTAPLEKELRGGGVAVVKGSRVTVIATANRDLSTVTVDGVAVEPAGATFTTPASVVDESREIALDWSDVLGLAAGKPLAIRLTARDDDPPTISVEGLSGRGVMLESESVRFTLQARDDYGVRRVGIEWVGSETQPGKENRSDVSDRARGESLLVSGGPEAEVLDGVGTFSPSALGITPQTIEVRVFAEDYLEGRPRVRSSPVVFVVMNSADHALWINEQIGRWRQQAAEVRDRELELLARNEELQQLPADELDAPHSRRAIRDQAAAERNNARRLARLADSGAELVRQAVRNPDFDAEMLEQLAQNVEDLKEMAESRMPGVGELLQAAAEAAAGEPAPKVGKDQGKPAPGKEGAATPSPPQVVDRESAVDRGEPQQEPVAGGGGQGGRLGLPTTTIGNSAASPAGPAAARPQGALLADAVEKQRQLVADFARIAQQLADVMARLEGTTFVKRLKAAARSESKLGEGLASLVAGAFGNSRAEPQASPLKQVKAVAKGNDDVGRKVSAVMDDLDAYSERRPQAAFRTVLEEMKGLDVLGSLSQLSRDMRREAGLSIAQTEFWSDTLDRWADELVPPPQPGGSGGAGPPRESLPPEVVLEAMLILEAEADLREETRVAQQVRPALDGAKFAIRATTLAEQQTGLARRLAGLADKLTDLPDGPVRFEDEIARMKQGLRPSGKEQGKFAVEIRLFKLAEGVMRETAGILSSPDTGRRAIAAETEVIELLLQSQFGGGGGGGGGGSPGGGSTGATRRAALARLGQGINRHARAEAPEEEQAIDRSASGWPEEFRDGLDAYFNAFERGRDREGRAP